MVKLVVSSKVFNTLNEYIMFEQNEQLSMKIMKSAEGKTYLYLCGEESLLPLISFETEEREENPLQGTLPFD